MPIVDLFDRAHFTTSEWFLFFRRVDFSLTYRDGLTFDVVGVGLIELEKSAFWANQKFIGNFRVEDAGK
jgi:hypothetical protein